MEKFLRLFVRQKLPLLVFISIIFIIGIGFGAFAVRTVDYNIQQDLFSYFSDFLKGYNNIDYQKSALINESIKFNLLSISVIWLFGMSVIIMPLVPMLVFFKGFVLGFTIGFLVSQFNFKGIILAIVTVFPQNVLIVPAYILAGVTAIAFSVKIVNYYRGRERLSFNDFINYSSKMILLGVLLLGGSLLETFVSPFMFRLVLRFF